MGIIEFHGVNKWFGAFQALKDIDFSVEEGEVAIGPSGKSTLLRCINGLEEFTSGELIVDGTRVHDKKTNTNELRTGRTERFLKQIPHQASRRRRPRCGRRAGGLSSAMEFPTMRSEIRT